MKIFIGCVEIASILSGIAQGFKNCGHHVTTFVFGKNKFYQHHEYDIVKEPYLNSAFDFQNRALPKSVKSLLTRTDEMVLNMQMERMTDRLIREHDLFVFIWKPWIAEEKLFSRIRAAGKKIICLHVGSDVRHISAYKQEFREDVSLWEQFFHDEDLNEKITRIRYHEIYANAIFSVPDQEGLAIRGYNHLHIPLYNQDAIPFNVPGNKIPVIVHAPSRSGIKGTSFICKAIDDLKSKGFEFEFRMLQNLPNDQLIKELVNADILVDELLLHGPGVLSFEAMAAGCLVLTRTLSGFKDVFNPPVIAVNPKNVHDRLVEVLNGDFTDMVHRGLEYVSKYNHPTRVAKGMLEKMESGDTEYAADFFLERYKLPPGIRISEKNISLTRQVVKKYSNKEDKIIKRGQEEGLL